MSAIIDRSTGSAGAARLWTGDFTLYFGARSVSMLGDAMMPVAVGLGVGAIYGVAGIGYALSVYTTAFLVFVLFGGVFADRIGARTMMVGADLVRVGNQGAIAIAFFAGAPPMWLLLVASFVSGTAAAMFQPGVNGMIPLVAKDPQRANATLKVADAATQLAGPALAGLLIALTNAGTVFTVDATTFLISAVCLGLIRLAPKERDRKPSTIRLDLRRGWQEFRARTWMWSVIVIWLIFGMLVLGPYFPLDSRLVGERLGDAAFGWVMAGLGAGTIIGGLGAIRFRPRRPLAAGGVAIAGFACIPLPVALEAPLPLLIAGHLLGGCALAFWSVMWATSVQTQVSLEVLNRVTAYEVAGSIAGTAVGQALVGPVSSVVDPRTLLFISSGACVTVCAALLMVGPIRRLQRV